MRKIFAVAALVISSQALSQQDSLPTPSTRLDQVVVTANKYPKKQSQTGKVITVIDRTQLDRLGARTLGEILNTAAGVTVNGANGPLGTNQRLSIRGSADGNVLLLIDGIPANDPSVTTNYFDLNFIDPAVIERVEILKGGQSTLYGSDAVSGVVNIITKKRTDKKAAPYLSASGGSYGTFRGDAGIRGSAGKNWYHAGGSFVRSEGFSAARDTTEDKAFDRDGFRQYGFRGEWGYRFSNRLQASVSTAYNHYKTDLDYAAFRDDRDYAATNRNLQAGGNLQWKQAKGSLHAQYQFNRVNRLYLNDSTDRSAPDYFSESAYTGRTHFAEVYERISWRNWEGLIGTDYRTASTTQEYHSLSSFGPYDTKLDDSTAHLWQLSPYASLVYQQGSLHLEGGGRFNYHSAYGAHATWSFNPSLLLHRRLKVFAHLSSAFKAPSLYQLFDPYIGNPDLDPEKSVVCEGGAEFYPAEKWRLRGTGFYRRTRNAIQYIITDPVFYLGSYRNVSRTKNYGLEWETNYADERWQLDLNYTYTRGRITSPFTESGDALSKDTTYQNLYRVPEHAANVFAGYQINARLSINTVLKYCGARWEPVYASAPRKLEDYFTADLSGIYRLSEGLQLFADLKNLTNKRYSDVFGYNARRFHVMGGVRWQW